MKGLSNCGFTQYLLIIDDAEYTDSGEVSGYLSAGALFLNLID